MKISRRLRQVLVLVALGATASACGSPPKPATLDEVTTRMNDDDAQAIDEANRQGEEPPAQAAPPAPQ